jgi:hypothetical protein
MKNLKSQRELVEELILSYCDLSCKYDKLEELGISIGLEFFNIDNLLDWALDIVGFPIETPLEEDSENEHYFSRDYLADKISPSATSANKAHSAVKEYVDFLYKELESLKKESPQLFR